MKHQPLDLPTPDADTWRVLVCGGREFTNRGRLNEALDTIHAALPVEVLIHGDCRGADRMAAEWGGRHRIPLSAFTPDWDNLDHPRARLRWNSKSRKFYDANAGFRRNLRMILEGAPNLVVAFTEKSGPGTADMVAKALKHGIAVLSVDA